MKKILLEYIVNAGTTIFNTTVGKLQTYEGSNWNDLW